MSKTRVVTHSLCLVQRKAAAEAVAVSEETTLGIEVPASASSEPIRFEDIEVMLRYYGLPDSM